jgi:hypothetical protein
MGSIPATRESPDGKGAEVVMVTDVVVDDADVEQSILGGQGWNVHPVSVPERVLFAVSSTKSLPGPLNSFDCLASIPHW